MKTKVLFVSVVLLSVAGAFIYLKKQPQKKSVVELHLCTWSNYIDPEVYRIYEQETGVHIIEDLMDSNEALENKLHMGGSGYDVIVPSDYSIQKFARKGLLATIDLKNIPNAKNLSPMFQSPYYDPDHQFSIPYLWGTSGIGFNRKLVSETPTGWSSLFSDESMQAFKGKISMLNDPREAIGAALKHSGFSVNSRDPEQILIAKELLKKQKPFIGRYDSETSGQFLLSGDLAVAHGWSGDILKYVKQDPENLGFIIPKEGGVVFADNLAIPSDVRGERKLAAEHFINFLLRDDINARIVNYVQYPSSIETAKALIQDDIRNNPNIYPSEEVLSKLEWLQDLGDETSSQFEDAWTEIKGQ